MEINDINELPEPQRSTVLAALTESVMLEVSEKVDSLLNEDQKKLLDQLLATEPEPSEVFTFLYNNVKDFDSLLVEITERKKVALLQTYSALKDQMANG